MTVNLPICDPNPWDFGNWTTGQAEYSHYVEYSPDTIVDVMRKMEFLEYEVDPAWKDFCEFTHEDIGGPFEKLGIIRRRPRLEAVYCDSEVMNELRKAADRINQRLENNILYGIPIYQTHGIGSNHVIGSWGKVR